jgi:hypothetical protein
MTATIKRMVTGWTVPALILIAGGFVCDGLTEVGHHALLIEPLRLVFENEPFKAKIFKYTL